MARKIQVHQVDAFTREPFTGNPTGVVLNADALTEAQMLGSAEHVTGTWRYERIEGPGHWMQLEAPDAVNELLLDFLPAP